MFHALVIGSEDNTFLLLWLGLRLGISIIIMLTMNNFVILIIDELQEGLLELLTGNIALVLCIY